MDGGRMEETLQMTLSQLVADLVATGAKIYEIRQQVRAVLEKTHQVYRAVVVGDDYISIRYGAVTEPLRKIEVPVPVEYIRSLPIESRP